MIHLMRFWIIRLTVKYGDLGHLVDDFQLKIIDSAQHSVAAIITPLGSVGHIKSNDSR